MLTQYYDQIFPVGVSAVNFLAQRYASTPGGKILDIGCGTGGHAVALAERGFDVTGIDLEPGMIERAQTAARNRKIQEQAKFYCMDLRDVKRLKQTFDGAYCIGNTLVHLPTGEEIDEFLMTMHDMLRPGAPWVIQILNYDWILGEGITELPLIENTEEQLVFKRRYILPKESGGKITFQTTLQVGDASWDGETVLRPMGRDELTERLTNAGFKALEWFSSMEGAPWRENALPLVVQSRA